MKKLFFFAATAAIALSSCSSDDLAQAPVAGPEVNDGAVTFDVYSARQTRAYAHQDIPGYNNAQNVTLEYLKAHGFGVFAYDQGQTKFVSYLASNTYPNFMYNQKVDFGGVTEWEPVDGLTEAQVEAITNASLKSMYTESTAAAWTPTQATIDATLWATLTSSEQTTYASAVATYKVASICNPSDISTPAVQAYFNSEGTRIGAASIDAATYTALSATTPEQAYFTPESYTLLASCPTSDYSAITTAKLKALYACTTPGVWDATGTFSADQYATLTTDADKAILAPKSYKESVFSYSPLKYWPNHGGYVTYQAYAPYNADITPIFNVAYNGTGIRYSNTENYDLLWGANDDGAAKDSYYDMQKPTVSDKTIFYFKHALAKVDFTVSYFTDKECNASSAPADGVTALDENTKIVVRSVRLVGDLPSTGVLSLYDGSWTVEKTEANSGYNTADLVIGGSGSTPTYTAIADPAEYGTLTSTRTVVKPAGSIMVIPSVTDAPVHIEITYDVITTDKNDDRNCSTVTNTIKSNAIPPTGYADSHSFAGITLESGKHTTVNIHLGLTSAKFDAHVVDWDTTGDNDVDLPNNKN